MTIIRLTQVTNSPPEFLRPFGSKRAELERTLHCPKGPSPIQLVVVMAVRKAVSAATTTFTAISIIRFFIR